ncbi:MAG: hypothetical protein ACRCZM_09095, partial [Bacteroidales bacterium]
MTALLLIVIAILIIAVVYFAAVKKKNHSVDIQNKNINRIKDLEALKKMAMADGVLTENEKKYLIELGDLSESESEVLFRSIEEELESIQSETEVIDWKKKHGIDFEKHIVSMLNTEYQIIESWTGDKYANGQYDLKNLDPDLLVRLKLKTGD